ncbi:MAG: carbamoyl phosphate synthase small subunit [Leptonema sp. (in: Bacteria)]|nr:carbamoyl phosphate synthase small subunit [Leptonema sp. (in: bacteria)]
MKSDSVLILENGMCFGGSSFGADTESIGNIVFNTATAGYQEILTDPASKGQILTMTYPMVGSYGVNSIDAQSERVHSAGLVVKKYVNRPFHYRSEMNLGQYLKKFQVPAIEGVDTRKLVITLRDTGPISAGIFIGKNYSDSLLEKVKSYSKGELDLAVTATTILTTRQPYRFSNLVNKRYRVAVIDFGVKRSTLQKLDEANFEVHVFPANTSAADIAGFDAIFLSHGPENPTVNSNQVESFLELRKPIMAIGVGQQMIAHSKGSQVTKQKSAGQGGNSVREMTTGQVKMVNSNSMYYSDLSNVKDIIINFEDVNSNMAQGFSNSESPILAVSFSPEGTPGPQDTLHLYSDFYRLVETSIHK